MTTRQTTLSAAFALFLGSGGLWAQSVPTLHAVNGDPADGVGQAVADVADLDGDGVRDLLIGSPRAGQQPVADGCVLVVSGRTGSELFRIDGAIFRPRRSSRGLSAAGSEPVDLLFGQAVVGMDDVDGDGLADFAVGAPGTGFPETGRVGVFSGAGGDLIHAIDGSFPGARFGFALDVLPDLDGDGLGDLLIGAPATSKPSETRLNHAEVRSAATGALIFHLEPGTVGAARFGHAVTAIDDLNLDGSVEFAVGAPDWTSPAPAGQVGAPVGAIFLYSGATGEALRVVTRGAAYSQFGAALDGGLDVNGDGVGDLLVGAPSDVQGHGAVHVYTGRLGAPADEGLAYSVTVEGRDEYGFGSAVVRAGDLDLDGLEDFLVGVPDDVQGGSFELETDGYSHVTLVSGADGAVLGRAPAAGPGWRLGTSLAFLGDVLGTGSRAFALGGPGFGLDNGVVMTAYVPGAAQSNGLSGPISVLEGRAGGPTLVRLELGGSSNSFGYQDIVFGPLVVVPKINGDSVAADLLVEKATAFSPFKQKLVGKKPSEATTGDFNLDGRDDFATANSGGDSFSVVTVTPPSNLGGYQTSGSDFGPVVTVGTGLNTTPRAIAAGDIGSLGAVPGRDGYDDILVSGDVGVASYVNDGMGGFVLADLEAVPSVTDIALGQLDPGVDTVPDALVTSGDMDGNGQATVLLGNPDGSLTPGGTFAVGPALASVLAIDVDGDGDDDALTVAHFVQAGVPTARIDAWLNDGHGAFSPSGWIGPVVESAEGNVPTYGAVSDLDGDGLLDAVYTTNDNLALPPEFFAGIEPTAEIGILTNLGDDGQGGWLGFAFHVQGTAYAGRVVVPIVEDVFTDPGDPTATDPDLILVWSADESSGQSPVEQPVSFIGLFVGDGEGGFIDPAPNQFDLGDQPGDGDAGDVGRPSDDPGVAAGGDGMPDLVFPNLLSNSLSVVVNDGAGGIAGIHTVEGVDELDVDALPPGVWSGGPRSVRLGHLDGDDLLDVVVYNGWTEEFSGAVRASISTYRSLGGGELAKTGYHTLGRLGELLVTDVDEDGRDDVVVSQTMGGNDDDTLLVFRGTGDGGVDPTPTVVGVPGGRQLTGGLIDGPTSPFGYARAVFTTSVETSSGLSRVVAFPVRPEGLGEPVFSTMSTSWQRVEGLAAADVDADGRLDLALGTSTGRLVIARGVGDGLFAESPVNPAAALVGGGALAVAPVDGDFLTDIVSSKAVPGGQSGVHVLSGLGGGDFSANVIGGISAKGALGAQRPLLVDFDGDLTTDVVLSHGTANSISILLSALNDVEVAADGHPGSAAITPVLTARGYTTLGSELVIEGGDCLGGAKAWLIAGTSVVPGLVPAIPVADMFHVMPMTLDGTPGQPGAGDGFRLSVRLPRDPIYVGFEFVLQLVVEDPGASGDSLSASGALRVTLLE